MTTTSLLRTLILRWVCLFAVLGTVSGAHIVKKGDTLYSIARANGVTVKNLMAVNGIKDPTKVAIGKRLTIPKKGGATAKKVGLKTTTSVRRAPASRSLTVILDPGHGGRDRGANYGGVRESDLNLKTAQKAAWYLKRAGYRVVMTRQSDRYVSLSGRAAIANRYRNAIFVSIHYNASRASSARGGETFYAGSKRGKYLAAGIQRGLVGNCRLKNRGVRYGRFTVLHQTNCPAVLVECGFISNSYERSRCKTSSFQDAAARAILSGVQRYDRVY